MLTIKNDQGFCISHNGVLSKTNFYKAGDNNIYSGMGYIPVCKKCMISMYENYVTLYKDTKKALFFLCRRIDVAYFEDVADSALKQSNSKGVIVGNYLKLYNTTAKKAGKHGCFDDGDTSWTEITTISDKDYGEPQRDVELFWGQGFADTDYEFLEAEYSKWESKHGCEKYSEEVLYKEICLTMLEIRKGRESNGNVDKKIETLQKLMDSANLKPANSVSKNDKLDCYGSWIRDVETEEPCEIFEKRPVYDDFDKFKEYMDKWVLRPLKNLLVGSREFEYLKQLESSKEAEFFTEEDFKDE